MKKYISYAVLFLVMIALAGCGETPLSTSTSSSTSNPIHDAISADTSLFDVGSSDPTFETSSSGGAYGINIVIVRCHSWKRIFDTPGAVTFTDISIEAATAEVLVNRIVTGVLHVKMTDEADVPTTEAFKQDFSRYYQLAKTGSTWSIKQVTQGISHSMAETSAPYNSMTSDITIESVSIYDTTANITFEITGDPSSEGPWIDYGNIATTERGNTLEVTVTTSAPYVFIWPDFGATADSDWFFRHQFGGSGPFSYIFRVPATETAGRKRMTIGAFPYNSLSTAEAPGFKGPYDFTSWHIPYNVQ